MFNSYRQASVWSSPEVLRTPKKFSEPSKPMDVYSFGMLLWEIQHEEVPFDGDLRSCTSMLLNEDKRPFIECGDEESDTSDCEDENDTEKKSKETTGGCSAPIAAIIRQCWTSEPS